MKDNLEFNSIPFFPPVLFKVNTCNVFFKHVKLFCAQPCRYYEKVIHP